MNRQAQIFYPMKSDKLTGKYRYMFFFLIAWFYASVVFIFAMIIYAFLNPESFFQSKLFTFSSHLVVWTAFLYLVSKPPLPHELKRNTLKRLSYHLTEEE